MTNNNNLTAPAHSAPLIKRMLQGAAIGLVLIGSFLIRVNHPHPDWGQYWMVRPLIITPMAGAAGAVFFYLTDGIRQQGGWKKISASVLSLLVFIIALWMGIVLGLNGTLWN